MTTGEFKRKLNDGPYAGFNLVFGNILEEDALYHCQNINHESMNKTEPPVLISNSEAHGLSNGKMDEWAKVKYGKI